MKKILKHISLTVIILEIIFIIFDSYQGVKSYTSVVIDGEENIIVDCLNSFKETGIKLDLKESEFENALDIVKEIIINELNSKGIYLDDTINASEANPIISVWFGLENLYGLTYYNDIHNVNVWVRYGYQGESGQIIQVKIPIIYSNSNEYNEDDKSYIEEKTKNLPSRIEIYENQWNELEKIIQKFLSQYVNDSSITFYIAGAMSFDIDFQELLINVFKDDVYYKTIQSFYVEASKEQLGDVNGDGAVTLADCTKILKHVKKTQYLTEEELRRADINGKDGITLADYTKLLKYIKNKEPLN